jgi:GT2 family glycosyltransferase
MSAKNQQPLVSIVLLNWNGLEDTKQCLESIAKLDYKNYEIVVVDNGSRADSKKWLSARPNIIYVDNPVNRGFTGGHIDGLKAAHGEFILLLNNDAVIKSDLLSQAIPHFDDPTIFAMGGRAYQWNDNLAVFDEGNPFYSFQEINPVTAEALTMSADLGMLQEVNNVSGSAVMIRKSIVDQIGYLHEPFFAYYEETDLFARAKRAGYKVLYNPAMMIWHKSGASTAGQHTFFFYYMFRNRWMFALRNFDQPFLRRFIKRHTITAIKSAIRGVIRRDAKEWAQFRGYLTSLWMTPAILRSRRELMATLGGGYSKKLFLEAPWPTTVAVNCRETTKNLEVTLSSVRSQQVVATDIIIVASSQTRNELARMSIKDGVRVVIDKQLIDIGFENFALSLAKHQWITFLECGDKLPETYLKQLLFLALERAAGVVYATDNKNIDPAQGPENVETIGRIYCVNKDIILASGGYDRSSSTPERHYKMLAKLATHRVGIIPAYLEDLPQGQNIFTKVEPLNKSEIEFLQREAIEARRRASRARRLRRKIHLLSSKSRKLQWVITYIEWVLERRISLRVKFGRTRRVLMQALQLNRKGTVLQLKHIRNELFSTQVEHYNEVDYEPAKTPVFIICRDRLSGLLQLISRLERMGCENIFLVDNGSTYRPLLTYFNETPYQVLPLDQNVGHTSPWEKGIINLFAANKYFVVTDPDVIPTDECPDSALTYLHSLLIKYPAYAKVGLGLKINDLPPYYPLKSQVIEWETQFWQTEVETAVYEAGVDTTFALYRPNTTYVIHPSLRTGEPYAARHLPWYTNTRELSEEDIYYRRHAAASINSWDSDTLRDRYNKEMYEEN